MAAKLDKIINDPHSSAEQRSEAAALKGQIDQDVKNSKCAGIVAGGNVTNDCH